MSRLFSQLGEWSDVLKHWGDALSLGVFVTAFFGLLPKVALILTVVWSFMRIVEMRFFQAIMWRVFRWDVEEWLTITKGRK